MFFTVFTILEILGGIGNISPNKFFDLIILFFGSIFSFLADSLASFIILLRSCSFLSKESIDPSSTDFISFHNRIGFFNEFQKQILTRRQKIKERFKQLQDRIQNLSDKGII